MADTYAPERFGEDGPTTGSLKSVDGLVIHHTGGRGAVSGVVNTLRQRNLGATFVMDRDGTVYRIVPEGARTQHATGYNARYEGIEVIANDDGDITPEQVEGFRQFTQWHAATNGYKIGPDTVLGHGEISTNKRATEGATLKWTFLQAEGFEVPDSAMVGDKGDGRPGMKFADAPAWVRRPPANVPIVASELSTSLQVLESTRLSVLNSRAIYGVRAPPGTYKPGDQMAPASEAELAAGYQIDDRMYGALGDMAAGIGLAPLGMAGAGAATGLEASAALVAAVSPVPLPIPRPDPPAPPLPRVRPDPAARGTAYNAPPLVAPTLTSEIAFGPMLGAKPAATPNSVDKLEAFTRSVYAGIVPIGPGDENLETAYDPSIPVKLRNPTVIPSGAVGRWEISPVRVADDAEIVAPKLSTAIAFDPTFVVKQVASTDQYAAVALAMDKFTLPPVAKSTAPVVDWKVLDGPAWNEAMRRREDWIRSRPKPASAAAPVKAPTVDDGRKEQVAARKLVKTQTSTSTVKTPTRPGVTGEVKAPTTPAQPIGRSRAPVPRVTTQPSTKPATTVVKVENPGYAAWVAKYSNGSPAPVAAPTLDETRVEQNLARRSQAPAPVAPVAPVVPPAPPRYIEKRVAVAPTATPSNNKPTMAGGLYVVAPGDTLSAIARRSGVSVDTLARINGISDPNKIIAGSKLRLNGSPNPIPPAPRGNADASSAAQRGASSGRTRSSNSPSSGGGSGVITGSSTGREYVVGKVYVNSQGVSKIAMADGTFQRV